MSALLNEAASAVRVLCADKTPPKAPRTGEISEKGFSFERRTLQCRQFVV